jgi:hypothetical protein
VFKIAVDFDGTIVEHAFPEIGAEVAGAIEWMKKFREAGALVLLWTVRDDNPDRGTRFLTEAVNFCFARGFEFDGVNGGGEDEGFSLSPKVLAHLYIDDRAVGCPLVKTESGAMVVDWAKVGPMVIARMEAA